MDEKYPSILEKELRRRLELIGDFKRNQEGIWLCIDMLVTASLTPIRNAPRCPNIDNRCVSIIMLWHTVWDYQVDSILLILSMKLDQGYAALRMASEAARDCARIGKSERNFELWSSRQEKHNTEEYKQVFRFNKQDSFERGAYQLYNIASLYGVHSHQTTDMYMEVCAKYPEHDLLVLKPSERGVFEGVKVWLTGFLPLQMCCILALPEKVRLYLREEIKKFQWAFEHVDGTVREFIVPGIAKMKREQES
jgi:hypothetical protein